MRLLKDIVLFLLIVSFINDDFIVDRIAGENSLKIIFGLFILVHIQEIIASFAGPKNRVIKTFYIFIFLMSLVLFINVITGNLELMKGLQVTIAILIVFVYFSYYENLDKLLYMIWFAVIISAIISLFNEPSDKWSYRISGGTNDENEFSVHLLAGMSIGVYLFQKHKNIWLFLGTSGLFLYALIYAGSRTAMLFLALAILYIILVKFTFVLKKVLSLKVLLGLLIVGIAITQYDFSKVRAIKGFQERAGNLGTAQERFISWKAGARMTQDNLILGVGADNYAKNTRKYAVDYVAEGSLAPHNIFIKMFAEEGFFVFVAFLYFLYTLLTADFRVILESEYFWLSLAVYAALFMGLTLSISYEKYFWLILALLSNAILKIDFEGSEDKDENIAHFA